MQHSPSWEATSHSASQENSPPFMEPESSFRVHKSPPEALCNILLQGVFLRWGVVNPSPNPHRNIAGALNAVYYYYYYYYYYYSSSSPLRFRWNIGPQQLSVAEVSVAFKFFIETGLVALCSNLQPGGPGLHIYIPCRQGGPVIPPGTDYTF
jgi:hypothetical protein